MHSRLFSEEAASPWARISQIRAWVCFSSFIPSPKQSAWAQKDSCSHKKCLHWVRRKEEGKQSLPVVALKSQDASRQTIQWGQRQEAFQPKILPYEQAVPLLQEAPDSASRGLFHSLCPFALSGRHLTNRQFGGFWGFLRDTWEHDGYFTSFRYYRKYTYSLKI